MSFLAALPIIGSIIDKVVPDKNAAQKAKDALAAMDKKGELQGLLGQLAINKVEAAHKSLFVAGWRPAVGWISAFGLLYNVLISPILAIWYTLPVVDPALLYPVLMGMLGLGGMRSFEKYKGVSRER